MAESVDPSTGEISFDPARHISKLSRRQKTADGQWKTIELDYMEVKYRLLWLRREHPDADIATELVTLDLDRNLAVTKASVSIPGRGSATGWGSETADDWRDFIEKSETKALGRALAALGFGTQFCEDFDFEQGTDKVVDAPVARTTPPATAGSPRQNPTPRPAQPATPPSSAASTSRSSSSAGTMGGGGSLPQFPMSEAQNKAIWAIARGKGIVEEVLEGWVAERFGCRISGLDKRTASKVIDTLKEADPSAFLKPASGAKPTIALSQEDLLNRAMELSLDDEWTGTLSTTLAAWFGTAYDTLFLLDAAQLATFIERVEAGAAPVRP